MTQLAEGLFKTEIEKPKKITRTYTIDPVLYAEFKSEIEKNAQCISWVLTRKIGEYIEESKQGKHNLKEFRSEPTLNWNESLYPDPTFTV